MFRISCDIRDSDKVDPQLFTGMYRITQRFTRSDGCDADDTETEILPEQAYLKVENPRTGFGNRVELRFCSDKAGEKCSDTFISFRRVGSGVLIEQRINTYFLSEASECVHDAVTKTLALRDGKIAWREQRVVGAPNGDEDSEGECAAPGTSGAACGPQGAYNICFSLEEFEAEQL